MISPEDEARMRAHYGIAPPAPGGLSVAPVIPGAGADPFGIVAGAGGAPMGLPPPAPEPVASFAPPPAPLQSNAPAPMSVEGAKPDEMARVEAYYGVQPSSGAPAGPPKPPVGLAPAASKPVAVGTGGLGALTKKAEASYGAHLGTFGDEKRLKGAEGELEAGKATVQNAGRERTALLQETENAIEENRRRTEDQEYSRRLDSYRREVDDIRQMKVDPHKLMKSPEFAISAAISSMLGGALAGFQGGENQGLAQMNRLIDRSIDAQEKEIANAKDAASLSGNELARLRQQTGDERASRMQLRANALTAFQTKLEAEAAQYDNPLIKNRAQQGIVAIDRELTKLAADHDAHALQQARAQAAAAAAAQAAAEEKRWRRAFDLRKLGIDEIEAEAKLAEHAGKKGDKLNEQTRFLGEKEGEGKFARADSLISRFEGRLGRTPDGKVDPSKGIPGVGRSADFRDWADGSGVVDGLLLSDDENISRKEWNELAAYFRNEITGAGMSDEERVILNKAFAGANTPAEQAAAITKARAALNAQRSAWRAGVSPEAAAEFDRRRSTDGAAPMPKSVQVKR